MAPSQSTRCSRLALLILLSCPSGAAGQAIEAVGARALGMGGAFVAVANDSSATWWNPAGLAVGPFVDVSIGGGVVGSPSAAGPAGRGSRWGVTVATPALGGSYIRAHILNSNSHRTTVAPGAGRQEGRVGVLPESLAFGQFGATVVQSVFPQVHVGATLKLVRGSGESHGVESSSSHIDADVGALGAFGPLRIGVAARQLFEPVIWRGTGAQDDVRLSRQIRLGAAFDGDRLGVDRTVPVVVALDADLRAYDTVQGPRRAVAFGAERWIKARRVGIRGGARVNTVGQRERVASVGGSVLVAKGIVADAHATIGARAERGWGVSARAAF